MKKSTSVKTAHIFTFVVFPVATVVCKFNGMQQYSGSAPGVGIYTQKLVNARWRRQVGQNTTNTSKEEAVEYFLKYWNLHRRHRFDFKRIMEPCKDDMKWRTYYTERTPYLISSANYSGIQLDIKPAGQFSRVLIESYSLMDTRKRIGGDSWRVLIRGERSVPVTVVDNMDGTYEASFLIKDPGFYQIVLSLEYTLCDGVKDPPPKWFNKGMFVPQNLKIRNQYIL